MIIKINMPDNSLQQRISDLNWRYSCPMVLTDPTKEYDPDTNPYIREFTEAQWAKMCLIDKIINHELNKIRNQRVQAETVVIKLDNVLLDES